MSTREAMTQFRRDDVPEIAESAAVPVVEYVNPTHADKVAPFQGQVSAFARLYFERQYEADPEALLHSQEPTADELRIFALAPTIEKIEQAHPEAMQSLRILHQNATRKRLKHPEAGWNPEDYTVPGVCSELFRKARREVIVEKVTESIYDLERPIKEQREVLQNVTQELIRPARSVQTALHRQKERDTYCDDLLHRTVDEAAKNGIGSRQFKRIGSMYQIMAADGDTNVTRRVLSSSIAALVDLTEKGKSPGKQLDDAVSEFQRAFATGQVSPTGTDYNLFQSFVRLAGQAYLTSKQQQSNPNASSENQNLLAYQEQHVNGLKALIEKLGYKIEERLEPADRKEKMPAATINLARTVADGETEKVFTDIVLEVAKDNQPGGKLIMRAAVVAAGTAMTVATAIPSSAMADPSGAPGQSYSAAPEQGTQWISAPNLQPQSPSEAGQPIEDMPQMGDISVVSEEESSVIPAEPTTTSPDTQAWTYPAPAEQLPTVPSPETPAPADPNVPDPVVNTGPQPNLPPAPESPAGMVGQATPGPAETTTAMPVLPPTAIPKALNDADYTLMSQAGNESDIIPTSSQDLKQYVDDSEYFSRADASAKYQESLAANSFALETTVSNPAPEQAQQLVAAKFAELDQAYNDKRDQLSVQEREQYVLSTLSLQQALRDENFLAAHDPSQFYSHGPDANAVRKLLEQEFGPEFKDQIGSGRYDVFLGLMTTAELQLLNNRQENQAVSVLDAIKHANQPGHDHQGSPDHGTEHHGNHHANGHHEHGNHDNNHGHHPKPQHPKPHHSGDPHGHIVRHESGPNLVGLSAEQVSAVEAIFRHTENTPHVRLAMLAGSYLESGWRPGAVGIGSYGIFQIQNPGPGGVHPDITKAQALNPDYVTRYMMGEYKGGVHQESEATWNSRPMLAAEESAYHAERPAEHYYESQGWERVHEAYVASLKVLAHYNHETPATPQRHNPDHAHHSDGYSSLAQTILRYPGSHEIVSHTDTGVPVPDRLGKLRYYSQWDERWRNTQYNAPSYAATIASGGCGPTSVAEVITTETGEMHGPVELARWMQTHGYRPNGGTDHEGILMAPRAYGLNSEYIGRDMAQVRHILDDLHGYVIVNGLDSDVTTPATTSGHFYTIRGITPSGRLEVNDPNSVTKSLVSYAPGKILGPASMAVGIWK
jgi:hypothetical protein